MGRVASTPADYHVEDNESCLTALIDQVRARPNGTLFIRPQGNDWVEVSAEEFLGEVYAVARGLIALGIEKGDRILLLSSTRYEWSLLDFAIWAAGAVSVPIYPSASLSQIEFIVDNSEAVLAISETQDNTEVLSTFAVDPEEVEEGSERRLRRVLEINSGAIALLKSEGARKSDADVDARIDATDAHELASLVYTSGTSGRAKGCRLTHYGWLSQVRALATHPIGAIARPGTTVLTYLPLAHVLARAVALAATIYGATQSHWPDTKTLPVELQRAKPNLLLGVPRVFEKVRNAAVKQASRRGVVGRLLFHRAECAAIEYSKALDEKEGPSRGQELRRRLYDKPIYQKIRQALGGNVAYCITGGSPMSPDLIHFFRGLGVPVYEGYGLTETTAAAAVNFVNTKVGTVGRPVGGVSITIGEDNEILIKGDIVFEGYWKNEEASKEAFTEDGWYRTGDLGTLDEDGYLTITGRKKDLIVTAGGKNVSPAPLEDIVRSHPLISQAIVVGEGKPFVGALITLDEENLEGWKERNGFSQGTSIRELAAQPALRAEIQDAINNANASVSHAEGIKKYHILGRELTEEEGELTPTFKVKRNVVAEHFRAQIEGIYG